MLMGRADILILCTILTLGLSAPLHAQSPKRKSQTAPKATAVPQVEFTEREARAKLREALNKKDFEAARYILDRDLYEITEEHHPAHYGLLNSYILSENVDVLDFLSRYPRLFKEHVAKDGLNYLQFAAKNGKSKSVSSIINAVKTDGGYYRSEMSELVVFQDPEFGRTALQWAIKSGAGKSIKEIYVETRDRARELKDKEGLTALDYYAQRSNPVEHFPLDLVNTIIGDSEPQDLWQHAQDGKWSWALLAHLRKDPQILMKPDKRRGSTPFHTAVSNERLETAKFLLRLAPGAAAIKDSDGDSPTHKAAANGSKEMLVEILKYYPEGLHQKDEGKNNLLMTAAYANSTGIVEFLIHKAPAQLRMKNSDGNSALSFAVSRNTDLSMKLATAAPEMLGEANKEGQTPIALAIDAGGHLAESLVQIRPSTLLATVGTGKNKTLTTQAEKILSSYAVTDIMLKQKPSFASEKLKSGDLPLHFIADQRHPRATIDELIRLYPKAITTKNSRGFYPLHSAAENCNMELVVAITKSFPKSVEQIDDEGNLPLHLAAKCDEQDFIKFLGFSGAYTMANKAGLVPIHISIQAKKNWMISSLAKASEESLLIKTPAGKLPIHMLIQPFNESAILDLAQRAPQTLMIPDNQGQLPIHLAALGPSGQVVRKLGQQNPQALLVADKDGQLPLHLLGLNSKLSATDYAFLASLSPGAVGRLNKSKRTPAQVLSGNTEKSETARYLEFLIQNPDKSIANAKYPLFKNKTIDEISEFSDQHKVKWTLDQEEFSARLEKALNSPELSEIRHALLLMFSNCPSTLKFENSAITPQRAISQMRRIQGLAADKTEWQDKDLVARLSEISELFDLRPRQSEILREIFLEMSSLGASQGVENRFIRLTAQNTLKINPPASPCEALNNLAKEQLEPYIGKVWREKFSMDENQLPMLAKVLSLEPDRLKVGALSTGFLPEDALGEKRQILNQVVLQCVECHDKDADYPLSFKKEDLNRVPDSPKSTQKDIRAEILRRVELPHSDKAHMPRGKDETLSAEQQSTLKKFLQETEK